MEDTCRGKDCWFYLLAKEMIGDKAETLSDIKNCPFYVEMLWTPNPIGGKIESAKIIKDCSNKRSLLTLLEDIHPRLTGVQQSQEQMRNESINATEIFSNFIQIATMKKEMKRVKTIEQERLEET